MNKDKKLSWTLEVQQSSENPEDLILEFPPDLLETAGWNPGDTLIWEVIDNEIYLKKQTKEETK